jgi:mono/diheme cytochrome c family protein
MPVGELFNTISNGVRNMPGYARQIPAEDRWAIILYVRALQRSRAATVADLSAQERASLK